MPLIIVGWGQHEDHSVYPAQIGWGNTKWGSDEGERSYQVQGSNNPYGGGRNT